MDKENRKGLLSKERFGSSMPVDAPYYQSPPFYYRDARALSVAFETDADSAAAILPEGLELPLPARATLIIVYYPSSTFGAYNEAMLGLRCLWQGQEFFYIPHIAVDSVPPLVGGREIWGYPKKFAHVQLSQRDELWLGTVERPAGVRLVTATIRPERPVKPVPSAAGGGSLSLRVMPSPEPNQPPTAELIAVQGGERQTHEIWSGPATVRFDSESTLDPWHALPVRRVLGGTFSRYDFSLPHGRVLHRY
jgi:acetoacetate decarboxylase